MIAEGINRLVTNRGGNADVISAVKEVFEQYRNSVSNDVQDLRVETFYNKCLNIFYYVLDNVRYQEDFGVYQLVKTPARLISDGVGDCKSMAIFIASCLWCLGCDVVRFRFVSFDNSNIYTHVYVVATHNGETITIDPVERINGQPVFNYARSCVRYKDLEYKRNNI